MPKVQSATSHRAWDPLFHFILAPIFVANFIAKVVEAARSWPREPAAHAWSAVVALALLLLCSTVRRYGLANQNRIIRLEERVRLAALVPAADVSKLAMSQLIALRFASDAELPALVARTLAEDLDPKAIKQSIATWRPDYERI